MAIDRFFREKQKDSSCFYPLYLSCKGLSI